MPCYLFTYHAYGSWMPDRPRGYVRRGAGILPTDHSMAVKYRRNATHDAAKFLEDQQLAAIVTITEAATHVDCRLHFVATDASHFHVLVSWSGLRTWEQNRTSLKRSLTIAFKAQFGVRPRLCDGASRKQVRDRTHFNYLITKYLPLHTGWKWAEGVGNFKETLVPTRTVSGDAAGETSDDTAGETSGET